MTHEELVEALEATLEESDWREPQDLAVELVKSYIANTTDVKVHVFVVWFCYTLGNWKAMVGTSIAENKYYEITHNHLADEYYIDVYNKQKNLVLSAE